MADISPLRICIAQPTLNVITETFIAAHHKFLRDVVGVVHHRNQFPWIDNKPVLSCSFVARGFRKFRRVLRRAPWESQFDEGYEKALKRLKPDVVLAEYGTCGASLVDSCSKLSIPLVTHFHGFDASKRDAIESHRNKYNQLFDKGTAFVTPSNAMRNALIALGCSKDRIICSPYGIDCSKFVSDNNRSDKSDLLAVGRFVEKKAPYLTILAFHRAIQSVPQLRLRMIGDGPLLGICKQLVVSLGIQQYVTFLGACDQNIVTSEMKRAVAFVQHSVVASDGDSEGTPVAILEALACGLPVVSTFHAGIPEVVIDEKSGLLSKEGDIEKMARDLVRIVQDVEFAHKASLFASSYVQDFFRIDQSIERLTWVLEAAVKGANMDSTRDRILATLPIANQSDDYST